MAEQVQHLQHRIQEREQKIHQLAEALGRLTQQQQSAENRHRIMQEIQFMSCFTSSGPVSVNAFIKNMEYYLNSITDPNARKAATRAIYQEKIQGEAKNALMGLPEPDNWDDIKSSLKLRYRPELEPAEIYRQITNLRGDTVFMRILFLTLILFTPVRGALNIFESPEQRSFVEIQLNKVDIVNETHVINTTEILNLSLSFSENIKHLDVEHQKPNL
ncbi:uncharacterized protein LOC119652113 [Hermetia illucens]|uniref:uncharacterized protein LOC119652113 n=1 Tax=Hermetia illucens TaxID=343691 RepID=UPI0018CC3208|nr:uncharacterized protein LOC119652113 [Hermetia illucens]